MDFKSAAVTLIVYITIIVIQGGLAGVLRRTPKVYNALITTDENLTPSRAYPVIQPHIHETAITYPTSYSYSGYSQYQPYESYSTAFNQYSPIQTLHYASRSNIIKTNPFLAISSEQQPYPFNNKNDSENDKQLRTTVDDDDDKNVSENVKEKPDQTSTSITNEIQTKQNSNNAENKKEDFESIKHPVPISNNNNNNKNEIPSETLPIELNEYGLPPSLIPISSSSSSSSSITAAGTSLGPTNTFSINNPINFLPFLYNSPHPLIYDQYSSSSSDGGYQSNPYLPPFGYYPPHIYFNDYAPNQQPSNKHSDNINNEIFSKDNSFTKQVQSEPSQEAATVVTDNNKVIQKIKINNLNDNDELSSKSSVDDSKNKSTVEKKQEPSNI